VIKRRQFSERNLHSQPERLTLSRLIPNLAFFNVSENPIPKPPEFFIKTGLYCEPIESNEVIWATGLVARLWTGIEHEIALLGDVLTSYDARSKTIFHNQRGTKRRIRTVRALVRRKVQLRHQRELLSIIDRISSMQQQRDRIIHGSWGRFLDGPDQTPFLTEHKPPFETYKWDATYNIIFAVAHKIDRILIDLQDLRIRHFEANDDPTIFSHVTLRRILRKPFPRLVLFGGRFHLPLPRPLARLYLRVSSRRKSGAA
jgi:hypothetical protein